MNLKKAICAFITISLMGAALTGCIKEQNITVEVPQTEIVTNDEGETVTQKNGEPVTVTKPTTTEPETVTVTDKSGKTVTQKDGKAVTVTVKQTSTVPQTVTVTDKAGKTVTQKNGKPVTETKPATTAATTAGTTASSTKKPSNSTTTKPSTTKTSATTTTQTPVPQPISIRLTKNGNAECSSDRVTISQNKVQIDDSGEYVITQSEKEWHGQIEIRLTNDKSASIRFENVNISNYNSPNIIKIIDASIKEDRSFIEAEATAGTQADNALKDEMKFVSKQESAPNVDLSFPTGTKSTFKSTSNSFTGVIYNESKLTIKGNGAVNFQSERNANNVICSTKSITFKNVSASLSTANNTVTSSLSSAKGIFSFSKVNVESGNLSIKTNGDCIRCEEFNVTGGNVNISSSAADGVDADDRILIYGGNVTSIALDKSAFKVRRVNNKEDGLDKDIPRAGKNDTFIINGGTVIGESKKITTVQPASTQASITCKAQKAGKGTEAAALESKVPIQFDIQGLKKSTNKCIKFLYSSSNVKAGTNYKITGGDTSKLTWSGKVGIAEITSSKTK